MVRLVLHSSNRTLFFSTSAASALLWYSGTSSCTLSSAFWTCLRLSFQSRMPPNLLTASLTDSIGAPVSTCTLLSID
uniref:Uncharacterized protein n=1 Tax=Arundo donax TaxID=35708 RepID=A0A0A9DV89_ARUDO